MKQYVIKALSPVARLMLMAIVVLWPAMALAQDAAPQPTISRGTSPLVGYGFMFVMLVIVMAITMMPSKRGHQD